MIELGKVETGNTPSTAIKDYYSEDGLNWITPTDITSNITLTTEKKLSKKGEKVGRVIQANSILCTCIASIGKNTFSPVKCAFNQQINALIPSKDNDPYFLFVDSYNWSQSMLKGAGGLTFQIVNKTEFSNIKTLIPSNEEQNKIGSLFYKMDTLITLHQQKLDKYKEIKQFLLEKMFPALNTNKLEIRFKSFNDAWEQRKAKELCSITTGKSNTQDQSDEGIYPFFIRSDIPVKSKKYLYDQEAVITIGDGNIGKVFHYVNGKFDLHQRCYKMADFKHISAKYFYWYFSTKFYKRAISMTAKATVDSVRLEMISEMDIKYPCSSREQNLIQSFLFNIDNLITLHQQKLDKYKEIKQFLLGKMFV